MRIDHRILGVILFGLTPLVSLPCSSLAQPKHPDPPRNPLLQSSVNIASVSILTNVDDGINFVAEIGGLICVDWGPGHGVSVVNVPEASVNTSAAGAQTVLVGTIVSHTECTPALPPLITPKMFELDQGTCWLTDVIIIGGSAAIGSFGGPWGAAGGAAGGYLLTEVLGALNANDPLANGVDITVNSTTSTVNLGPSPSCATPTSEVPASDPPPSEPVNSVPTPPAEYVLGPDDTTYNVTTRADYLESADRTTDEMTRLTLLANHAFGVDRYHELGRNAVHAQDRLQRLAEQVPIIDTYGLEAGNDISLTPAQLAQNQAVAKGVLVGFGYTLCAQEWSEAMFRGEIALAQQAELIMDEARQLNDFGNDPEAAVLRYSDALALLLDGLHPGFNSGPAPGDCDADGRLDLVQILEDPPLDLDDDGWLDDCGQLVPWNMDAIEAPAGWVRTRGSRATIAIFDTGIDLDHPEFEGRILDAQSFVPGEPDVDDLSGHGTFVAGIVASADNGAGIIGVAPEASLLIGKVVNQNGQADEAWIIDGINWAVAHDVDVILIPFGGLNLAPALETAIDAAAADGILVVSPVGDQGSNTVLEPASYASVIAVAALDELGNHASFSNTGPSVELAAPGVGVISTVPVGQGQTAEATWLGQEHEVLDVIGSAQSTAVGSVVFCGLGMPGEFPPTVAGNIAHCRRGAVSFEEKVQNAEAAGALGIVISNDQPGRYVESLSFASPLVAVAASQADGDELMGNEGALVSITVQAGDILDSTSSAWASAHVAGMAALLADQAASEAGPPAGVCTTADDIRRYLQEHIAADLDGGRVGRNEQTGFGMPTVDRALAYMDQEEGSCATPVPPVHSRIANARIASTLPNPFNPRTEIQYELGSRGHVELVVYDLAGRKVATLVDRDLSPGSHAATWNGVDDGGRRVASGVYLLALRQGTETDRRKVVLIK